MASPRRIQFLAYPGIQALDIVGPHQMFAGANDEAPGAYALSIAAAHAGPFACSSGLALTADRALADIDARALRATDTLIVVGGGDAAMSAALQDGAITAIAAKAQGRARRIASVCAGAFFLAAAGLLDGKRAATHWRSVDALKRFRPAVDVDADAIFLRAGDIWTSAGVTAGIDLALAMIEEDLGRAVALKVARRHVISRMRSGGQAQFSAELDAQAAPDGALEQLTRAIIAAPAKDWSVDAMAARAHVAPRSLSRLFARTLRQSPAAFVERVRVDAARAMLVETTRAIDQIAAACGFSSLRHMDRAFQRTLTTTPSAFRARFSSPKKERRR